MRLYKLGILLIAAIIFMVSYKCDCRKEITKGARAISGHKARCQTHALRSRTVGGLGKKVKNSTGGGRHLRALELSQARKVDKQNSSGPVEAGPSSVGSTYISLSF